jgi:hypothetical protein
VPFRITVGKKLSAGLVELVDRRTKQSVDVPVADAARSIPNPGTDGTFSNKPGQ